MRKILPGIAVSLEELIALRSKVLSKSLQRKKLSGEFFSEQSLAKIRGRGIEFASTREYQPGDDIRCMAWRITARSLKPHVKVYHEERERPVWLGVDLSPSLYFGTRCMFKSVRSIKQAAWLGWSHLNKRERIGAFIATPEQTLTYTPKAREREFLLILKSLSECSNIQPTFNERNCLQHLLMTMQAQIRAGNLLVILSDFFQFDNESKKLIAHFAQRAQVKLVFVYDPFEAEPPPPYHYVLTNGRETAAFNTEKGEEREQYRQQFQHKLQELMDFARKHNISLQTLSTDQEQEVTI